MAIILVVAAWAVVQVVLAVAAVSQPAPKDRPSIFSALADVRL